MQVNKRADCAANTYYNKKQDCLSRVVMVTDEKPQILNNYCSIQFYFKSIEQTITFKLCFISQFKCNGLHDSFEIVLNITIIIQYLRVFICDHYNS